MKKELEKTIERYNNSQTSLESYQAISDFVEAIKNVPEFITQIEKEGEEIRIAQIKLNLDKGWTDGLRGKDLERHNQNRDKKGKALFELDPLFPLSELEYIHDIIKSENRVDDMAWLFRNFSPNELLPSEYKNRYQGFIDRLFKKIQPFLNKDKKLDFGFDSEKSILYFQESEIPISLKNDKSNAHFILKHIFESDDMSQQFSFLEIAEDTFKEEYENWMKYYRACNDANKKVYKATKIDDFLEFSTGKSGWVTISKKYLE